MRCGDVQFAPSPTLSEVQVKFTKKLSLLLIASSFVFATAHGQIVGGTIGGAVHDSSGAHRLQREG